MDDTARCPECGALLGTARTCEELFHKALLVEWTDTPRTAVAHHLLVATYMLQHPSRFTEEGRAAFAATLIAAVDGALSGPALRAMNRARFGQQRRAWRFRLPEPARPTLRQWPLTIADALDGVPEELPARIWRWARSTREELRALDELAQQA